MAMLGVSLRDRIRKVIQQRTNVVDIAAIVSKSLTLHSAYHSGRESEDYTSWPKKKVKQNERWNAKRAR